MTRTYEAMYIVDPRLDDDGVAQIISKFDDAVKKVGGTVERTERQGRKKLSYTVKKHNDGFYVLSDLALDPKQVGELDRLTRLTEGIIRHLFTRRDG